jgi:hypothetical protein
MYVYTYGYGERYREIFMKKVAQALSGENLGWYYPVN